MSTQADRTVANTIRDQLGRKCLFMLGAHDFTGETNCLWFQIGRNSKGINGIKIALNGMDLYDLEFYTIGKAFMGLESESKDVYAEDLQKVIESETGMRTSL